MTINLEEHFIYIQLSPLPFCSFACLKKSFPSRHPFSPPFSPPRSGISVKVFSSMIVTTSGGLGVLEFCSSSKEAIATSTRCRRCSRPCVVRQLCACCSTYKIQYIICAFIYYFRRQSARRLARSSHKIKTLVGSHLSPFKTIRT